MEINQTESEEHCCGGRVSLSTRSVDDHQPIGIMPLAVVSSTKTGAQSIHMCTVLVLTQEMCSFDGRVMLTQTGIVRIWSTHTQSRGQTNSMECAPMHRRRPNQIALPLVAMRLAG